MWYLCQHFQTNLEDVRISEMDPVQKLWMYENWLADQNEQAELAKNHAYLLASFWNPEAVKQILGEGEVYVSSDEEFEESYRMVKEINAQNEKNKNPPKKRRSKLIQ